MTNTIPEKRQSREDKVFQLICDMFREEPPKLEKDEEYDYYEAGDDW